MKVVSGEGKKKRESMRDSNKPTKEIRTTKEKGVREKIREGGKRERSGKGKNRFEPVEGGSR